jgi:plasmid stabilization system protein ParE
VAPDVGHVRVPTVAGPVEIEWSVDALADLDRFATFLHDQFPELAARVAGELVARTDCSVAIRGWDAHSEIGTNTGRSC